MCVAVTLIHPCLIFVGKVGTYPRVESSNQLHFRPGLIFEGKAGAYPRVARLHFRPSLIFADKAGIYPKVESCKGFPSGMPA